VRTVSFTDPEDFTLSVDVLPPIHGEADRCEALVPSVDRALRTIQGYEAMNRIRNGQVNWLTASFERVFEPAA
jgi:hypothetical protein